MEANMQKKPSLANANEVAFLFVDHQSGLLQTVKSISATALRTNVAALAKAATLLGAPVVYTASVPDGPNGPILSEIKTNAPKAVYATRHGQINAWDEEEFVAAVEATGKKTLIISGIWTSVCVTFPSLRALAEGYTVYAVPDASGDVTKEAHDLAVQRMIAAGVIPVSTNGILAELQKTWNREDAAAWGELYAGMIPNYQAAIESYYKAQEVAEHSELTAVAH